MLSSCSLSSLRRMRSLALWWIVATLCVLISGSDAMFDKLSYQFSQEDMFDIIWAFEFAEKGTVSMQINVDEDMVKNNATIQLLFCPDSTLSDLRVVKLEQVCAKEPFTAADCQHYFIGGNNGPTVNSDLIASKDDWYYLLQLNCGKFAYTMDGIMVARNPGGYLSLSESPFQNMYMIITGVWGLFTLTWTFSWLRYWPFNIRLQALYTLVPLITTGFSSIMLVFWRECQDTGHRPMGMRWSSFAVATIGRLVLFSLLMVTGKGWSLVQKKLTREELRQIGGLVLALTASYACFLVLGGVALFILVLMYVTAMRYVFASVGVILMDIEEQGDLLRSAGVDPNVTPLFIKRSIFKNFHLIMLAYISTSVIFHLWASIFLMRIPWLADLIDHVMDMALFCTVAYNIRMRPFRPHFVFAPTSRRESRDRRDSMGVPLIGEVHHSDLHLESGRSRIETIWNPGMPVPRLCSEYDYAPWLHPYAETVMLVDNPRQDKTAGDRVVVARPAYY